MSTRLKRTNVCRGCRSRFHPYAKEQAYCSRACFIPRANKDRRSRRRKTCATCGARFEVKSYRARSAKYCSKACWETRNPPTGRECVECGAAFSTYIRTQVLCSPACSGAYRARVYVGELAAAWKDGRSGERNGQRQSPELRAWRAAVFERDGYTCQHCGGKEELHAHHVKEWADYPALRFDVANGLTLCVTCHGNVHGVPFASRRPRLCPDCGAQTKGRGREGRCRSCAITLWHRTSK